MGAGKVSAWMPLPAADGQLSHPKHLTTGSLQPPSIRDLGPVGLASTVATTDLCPHGPAALTAECQACARGLGYQRSPKRPGPGLPQVMPLLKHPPGKAEGCSFEDQGPNAPGPRVQGQRLQSKGKKGAPSPCIGVGGRPQQSPGSPPPLWEGVEIAHAQDKEVPAPVSLGRGPLFSPAPAPGS